MGLERRVRLGHLTVNERHLRFGQIAQSEQLATARDGVDIAPASNVSEQHRHLRFDLALRVACRPRRLAAHRGVGRSDLGLSRLGEGQAGERDQHHVAASHRLSLHVVVLIEHPRLLFLAGELLRDGDDGVGLGGDVAKVVRHDDLRAVRRWNPGIVSLACANTTDRSGSPRSCLARLAQVSPAFTR